MPTTYNKVTAGGNTLIDLSQDTVTQASHIMAGYVGHLADGTQVEGTGSGGTYQAKTNIDPTTSSQTIQPDYGYDALSSVQINAMPSGTAGTPTATKGTVSNHSVSVTPSVTNTTGYITGSTKTGTAVTVSASELVSGSETKTANGTYDVTNLAQLIVNVSGSGGLEYESGTYTPASDEYWPTISFSKTHSSLPIFAMVVDSRNQAVGQNSNMHWAIANWYTMYSLTTKAGSTSYYGQMEYGYTAGSSYTGAQTSINSTTNLGRYLTTSSIKPYCGGSSRYFKSGVSYYWIAVWKPTT